MVVSAENLAFFFSGDEIAIPDYWLDFIVTDQLAQRYGVLPSQVREHMDEIDIWSVHIIEDAKKEAKEFAETARAAKEL